MKVKFVCDCCDTIFEEFDVKEKAGNLDEASLTDEASRDIILQNRDSEVSVSSTCRDCRQELEEYYSEDGHRYYKAPLLH